MKKGQYTEEKIISIIQEYENGSRVPDICRKYGMAENTFYKWKAKYAGMTVSEAKRLKQLEDENRRLKKIVADQALDIEALKSINSKNF